MRNFFLCLLFADLSTKEVALDQLEQLKAGNLQITRMVYESNRAGFFAFMRKLGAADEILADLYQDAFLALLENIRKGRLETLKVKLSTYLFAIGKYKLLETKNKTGWIPIDENTTDRLYWHTYEDTLPEGFEEQLQKHFNQLGEKCRQILRAFYYEEQKLDEIVVRMGYENKDTAKSQKSRCLQQLKKMIRK